MLKAAQLRAHIETSLARRIPGALTPVPQQVRPVVPTSIAEIDALLGGGLPVGAISEIAGAECTGRTTLTLSFLGQITRMGQVCAFVDVSDTLDPYSAAATGVDLGRMLWVRCGGVPLRPSPTTTPRVEALSAGLLEDHLPAPGRPVQGGGSPHPRGEVRGLDHAIEELMQRNNNPIRDKTIATPGARNYPLSQAGRIEPEKPDRGPRRRIEQIPSDRLPSRRGAMALEQRENYEPRCAGPQSAPRRLQGVFPAQVPGRLMAAGQNFTGQRPWLLLDQALRITDLILQAGGFGAIVLDLGSIAPEYATRIPLATWFRYRAAAERSRCSLVLLTQTACARSSAGVVLHLSTPEEPERRGTSFEGLRYTAELSRQRFLSPGAASNLVSMKKPPASTHRTQWRSRTAWTGAR